MNRFGHLVVGGFVSGLFLLLNAFLFRIAFSLIDYLLLLGVWFVYSQLPDIDQKGSHIHGLVLVALVFLGAYSFIWKSVLLGSLCIIGILFLTLVHHRTIVHTVVFGVLLSSFLGYFSLWLSVLGFVLYLSHLIADGELTIWQW